MPIKPENRARYPKDWPQIREKIARRAGFKCENCGVRNYALGGRRKGDGLWMPAMPLGEKGLRLEWPKPGQQWWCGDDDLALKLKIVKIVCTTAHLDHTPENCSDDNLRFWCQKCHLNYDHDHHQRNARETRRKGKAVAELFPEQGISAADCEPHKLEVAGAKDAIQES